MSEAITAEYAPLVEAVLALDIEMCSRGHCERCDRARDVLRKVVGREGA